MDRLLNRKNLIERIIRSIIKSTELFARIILIFREIIAKESQDRHNFLIIPRRRWREEGRIKSTIYRVSKRFKSVSRFEAHAFTRDACVPGNIRGITRYTHAHTFVQIGVSRVAHCIYYCYYYYFVSFPFVLPPPRPLLLFFFVRHGGETARKRETEKERESEETAVRRRDAIRRVATRMWKYDGNISLFAALARPDDSVAVPRHEAFISKYVYIHCCYVQAPGSSLNKCRSIYKGGEMRISPLPLPSPSPSSFVVLPLVERAFPLSRFVSFLDFYPRNGRFSLFSRKIRFWSILIIILFFFFKPPRNVRFDFIIIQNIIFPSILRFVDDEEKKKKEKGSRWGKF